jgi:hypothetical protein
MALPLALTLLLLAASASAAPLRSPTLRAEFQRIEPCPSTGLTRGACPGYEVDHAVPLCLGGSRVDIISNLQWLSIEAHRRKTAEDVRLCRLAARL